MIRGAIFDADGTLLNSMPIWEDAASRYLRELGLAPEEGLGKKLLPMSLEEGGSYLRARYGLPQPVAEVKRDILRVIADFYRHEVQWKAGAPEFLEALKERGVPMAIVTSGDRELLAAALERLGAAHYFKAVFTCSELNTSKREPEIYRVAANCLGLRPGEIAVFEDALFALETARSAGFVTVAVEDPASADDRGKIQATADYYMKDFLNWANLNWESWGKER